MPDKHHPCTRPDIVVLTGDRKQYAPEDFVREHVLCHIYSGELRFTEAEKETVAKAGETILFRRDLLVKCEKRPVDGVPFMIVHFVLERAFLQQYAIENKLKKIAGATAPDPVLFIDAKPPLQGLLQSLQPYLASGTPLSSSMVQLKLHETVLTLLEQDINLGCWLFDCGQSGKIDLQQFMQRNYMFNVPITKFAELTGRSLSTFQRDFQKIFDTNAGAWLLKRRLQAAYEAITVRKKMPAEIYLELGFEDIAHFSRSFKREFGMNASQLTRHAGV